MLFLDAVLLDADDEVPVKERRPDLGIGRFDGVDPPAMLEVVTLAHGFPSRRYSKKPMLKLTDAVPNTGIGQPLPKPSRFPFVILAFFAFFVSGCATSRRAVRVIAAAPGQLARGIIAAPKAVAHGAVRGSKAVARGIVATPRVVANGIARGAMGVAHGVTAAAVGTVHVIRATPQATANAVHDVVVPPEGLPTSTRNSALAFPAGGWIYLLNSDKPQTQTYLHDGTYCPSVPILVATGVLAGVLANNLSHGNQQAALGAFAGLFAVRFGDILGSVRTAERLSAPKVELKPITTPGEKHEDPLRNDVGRVSRRIP